MTVTALDRHDPATAPAAVELARLDLANAHRHGRHCYWDHRECRWRCTPAPRPA